MDKCLKAAGAGAEHVVKVQVFMTDITERPKINPRRIAYFGDNLPVSTLVEVKGLVDPRMKVEIECQPTWSRNGRIGPAERAVLPERYPIVRLVIETHNQTQRPIASDSARHKLAALHCSAINQGP